MSKCALSSSRNVSRFRLARLQAVSSRNMYSLHGLLALIRPEFGQVCHSLIVVSYCRPGSAQRQAAQPICSHSSRAGTVLLTRPSVRQRSCQSLPFSTASRNSSVTRTLLLLFCPLTVM